MISQLEHRGVCHQVFARQLLEIVRTADQPLSTRGVNRGIMRRLRMNPFDRDVAEELSERVEAASNCYHTLGLVDRLHDNPMVMGWRIADEWTGS